MKERDGFVLVLVLMTILLVAIVAASFSSFSFKTANHALLRHREMKLRWGTISCQRVALDIQRGLAGTSNRQNEDSQVPNRRQTRIIHRIELDGIEYMIIVNDESAKVDLNNLLELVSESQVESVTRTLLRRGDASVDLQPLSKDQVELSPVFPPLQSWDQVLKNRNDSYLNPEDILHLTNDLTLWGGKLNYHSASDDALRETVKAVAGAITADRFVSLRADEPELSLPEVKNRLTLTENQQNRIEKVLSDRSNSQSVGIISLDGNRVRYSLLIRRTFAGGVDRYYSFTW